MMERCGYLWGTREKDYCELGRSRYLESLLRGFGAQNPDLALGYVKNLLFGFAMLPGYPKQEERPVSIRYSPMHLYKKRDPSLQNLEPFAAVSVNGLEYAQPGGDKRESYYSYLTVIGEDELLKSGEFNYLDHIFGVKQLTWNDVADWKNQTGAVDFDAIPEKVVPFLIPRDKDVVTLAATALYSDIDSPVILRLETGAAFNRRSRSLLVQLYSLLPPRMAAETGFVTYEKPENIMELVQKNNTRVFVIPGECELPSGLRLPEKAFFIDLNKAVPRNPDSEFAKAVLQWCGLSWPQRQQAMEVLFNDGTQYFKRDYYIETTREFFESRFFQWEESPKTRLRYGDEPEEQVAEAAALYRQLSQYSICRIPWIQDRFAAQLPNLLSENHTPEMLRAAAACMYAKTEDQGLRKEYSLYYRWLSGFDRSDVAFLAAEETRNDERRHGRERQAAAVKEEQSKWQEQVKSLEESLKQADSERESAVKAEAETWREKVDEVKAAHKREITDLNLELEEARKMEKQREQELDTWKEKAAAFEAELEEYKAIPPDTTEGELRQELQHAEANRKRLEQKLADSREKAKHEAKWFRIFLTGFTAVILVLAILIILLLRGSPKEPQAGPESGVSSGIQVSANSSPGLSSRSLPGPSSSPSPGRAVGGR